MSRPRVLITGASRGIGRACALALAPDFDLVLNYRNGHEAAAETAKICRELGAAVELLPFDVSDRAACLATLKSIEDQGPLWGVVLNAGITRDNTFPALEDADWDLVLRTNLDAFYNVLHPLVMPMVRAKKGGRIVVLSSVSGIAGNRGQTNYAAAKGGLIAAAKSLAIELASRNITVNCVAPGLIDTDMTAGLDLAPALEAIPMKRSGKPEEVAATVAFLFSKNAGYITRQVISVNGGLI
ncbi:MAG: 3-oxoacyl-ACP reductase FabG [Verrucomicrobiota bacterium]|jgi:3-oxoacyl-[acyl-carrier protein] reductase